ncbi:MAG: glycosyltransferase [Thermodesulfovibrionales bacterium]
MSGPLVSIIVRTKDRPQLLMRALRSIIAQTYRPLEVILVNDGGCDLDVEEIKSTLQDVSLNYIRLEKNTGRAHAGNVGLDNAKGEYMGFLDDDDELYSEHISALVPSLKNTDCKIAYTDSEIIFGSYNFGTMEFTETGRRIFSSKDFSMYDLLVENYIPLITILFNKDVFLVEKGFDEGFEAYEDWDLLIRCGVNHPFHHIKMVTTSYVQWSRELQIAQSSEYAGILEREYDRVLQKHAVKYVPDVVRFCRDSLAGLKAAAVERDARIETLLTSNNDLQSKVSERDEYIRFLQSGRGWRLLSKYYRVRDRFLNVFH